MSAPMSALRKTEDLSPAAPAADVPGLAYYTAQPANLPARPAVTLSALDQMFAYWTRD